MSMFLGFFVKGDRYRELRIFSSSRYDDHYFCTDPEEFIYEFFPDEAEWQLLPRPITLRQFELLPFVRSLFFRYGLRFTDPGLPSIVYVCCSQLRTNALEDSLHYFIAESRITLLG